MDTFFSFGFIFAAGLVLLPLAVLGYLVLSTALTVPEQHDSH